MQRLAGGRLPIAGQDCQALHEQMGVSETRSASINPPQPSHLMPDR